MNMHTSVTPKIFFLDRDGTINVDTDFVHRPEEWEFCPGAPQAIRRLNAAGFKVVVVTNQSGVIRKRFSMADVVKLHEHAAELLAAENAHIDAWFVAPWHPNLHTDLHPRLLSDRKPDTGMFLKALRRFKADPTQCFMAGDKLSDLKPAIELGMTPFLIKSRFYESQDKAFIASHDIPVYDSLLDVVEGTLQKSDKG
jgi:D-glycero-D-manno-heptose 1,7-bisphosphate phosphatase